MVFKDSSALSYIYRSIVVSSFGTVFFSFLISCAHIALLLSLQNTGKKKASLGLCFLHKVGSWFLYTLFISFDASSEKLSSDISSTKRF
jgi:hypothetical protein